MQGTWSMVFRGKEADIDRLIAGVETVKDDPAYAYIHPLWKEAADCYESERTGGNAENLLALESEDAGAIGGIPQVRAKTPRRLPYDGAGR